MDLQSIMITVLRFTLESFAPKHNPVDIPPHPAYKSSSANSCSGDSYSGKSAKGANVTGSSSGDFEFDKNGSVHVEVSEIKM